MKCFLTPGLYNHAIRHAKADPIPPKIRDSDNNYPYFEDCVGPIDGTHIPAHVPLSEQNNWRDRKGHISQNVLASCDFDLRFTNLVVSNKGSVADSTLWTEAMNAQQLHIPAGKYVLGNAGFSNCDSCLIPYTNTRYYLQEWTNAKQ